MYRVMFAFISSEPKSFEVTEERVQLLKNVIEKIFNFQIINNYLKIKIFALKTTL